MKNKRESGEVVVEASIVVTLVMIVITIMLYVGMILYQQTLVSVMANQTASNIAQVYSNNLKDPFTGYVDPDRVYQSITYSNMKTDAYMSVVEQKANIFAQYRLKSSRILTNGTTSVEVQIVKKPNELLKSQIVVTIRDRYDVPLVGIFGTSGLVSFASSGRADCVDILEYVNGVEAVGDPENSNVAFLPDSRNCTVTFIPDGDDPGNFTVETVLKGHSIMSSSKYTHCVMPGEPQKGDLEFAGWYTADGSSFTATKQIDENITVYGKWLCQVTLDAKGGTVNGQGIVITKVPYGSRILLPNPLRDGFMFEGWFDETGNAFEANDTVIVENCKYTARWQCLHKWDNGESKLKLAERKRFQCRDVAGRQDSYEMYRCTDCAYEEKVTIANLHYASKDYHFNNEELMVQGNLNDFTAQCNTNHSTGATTGVSGDYGPGFGTATIYFSFHIVCEHCGMILPKVFWDNIDKSDTYDYIYWTSFNSERTVKYIH